MWWLGVAYVVPTQWIERVEGDFGFMVVGIKPKTSLPHCPLADRCSD